MLDLRGKKDAARVLRNAMEPGINKKGFRVIYAEGDFGNEIGRTEVGRVAWSEYEAGRARLYQALIQVEPRMYAYIAEVV